VTYDVETGTSSFSRTIAHSSGYVLVGTAGNYEGSSNEARNQALDRAFKYAAARVDRSLGTQFINRR
jgi:hypothetical protein